MTRLEAKDNQQTLPNDFLYFVDKKRALPSYYSMK
jgi:hypothetical protein